MRLGSATYLLFWLCSPRACLGYVDFLYPGPSDTGLTYDATDIVWVTWASDIPTPYFNVWCSPSPSQPQSNAYGELLFFECDSCSGLNGCHQDRQTIADSPQSFTTPFQPMAQSVFGCHTRHSTITIRGASVTFRLRILQATISPILQTGV